MAFRSGNPVFKKVLNNGDSFAGVDYEVASYKGIGLKILYYVAITFIAAILGIFILTMAPVVAIPFTTVGGILTFIFAFVAILMPSASKIFGTLYCIFEGIFIGMISFVFEELIPGVVLTALLGTLSVVLVISVMYMTGIVKVGSKFRKFLLMFALSFLLCNLFVLILSIFPNFRDILKSYWIVLITSVASTLLASLYLLFDMQSIREIVESGQPKTMEWYAAFGMSYTILWLYIEIFKKMTS